MLTPFLPRHLVIERLEAGALLYFGLPYYSAHLEDDGPKHVVRLGTMTGIKPYLESAAKPGYWKWKFGGQETFDRKGV